MKSGRIPPEVEAPARALVRRVTSMKGWTRRISEICAAMHEGFAGDLSADVLKKMPELRDKALRKKIVDRAIFLVNDIDDASKAQDFVKLKTKYYDVMPPHIQVHMDRFAIYIKNNTVMAELFSDEYEMPIVWSSDVAPEDRSLN